MKTVRNATHIVGRLERGEETIESLLELVREHPGLFGRITAIGAADEVEFSIFDTATKEYERTTLRQATEITDLSGLLGRMGDEPYVHVHANFGLADGSVVGGHVNRAVISGTLEFVVDVLDFDIDRFYDDDVGLNLLKID